MRLSLADGSAAHTANSVHAVDGAIAGIGYNNIPDYWKMGLSEVENINFQYTDMSLSKVYEVGYGHALEMIKRNGGKVGDHEVSIAIQKPETVRFEKSFEGMYPVGKIAVHQDVKSEHAIEFEGTGIVLRGYAQKESDALPDYVFDLKLFIDGKKVDEFRMPTNFKTRRHEIFWRYDLPKGKHEARVVITNPKAGYHVRATDYIVYSDTPVNGVIKHAITDFHNN